MKIEKQLALDVNQDVWKERVRHLYSGEERDVSGTWDTHSSVSKGTFSVILLAVRLRGWFLGRGRANERH